MSSSKNNQPVCTAEPPLDNAPLSDIPEAYDTVSLELRSVRDTVNRLQERKAGWNGYNVAAPLPEAIRHALCWIERLAQDMAVSGMDWLAPHVTSDEEGNVVFEWQQNAKQLTVYILPESVEYIRVPSTVPGEEIEDGEIRTESERRALWKWLMG